MNRFKNFKSVILAACFLAVTASSVLPAVASPSGTSAKVAGVIVAKTHVCSLTKANLSCVTNISVMINTPYNKTCQFTYVVPQDSNFDKNDFVIVDVTAVSPEAMCVTTR